MQSIFRAYDIRGVYPQEINEELAYKIAQAYAKIFEPRRIVLGRDVRLSGPALFEAASRGFMDHGVSVIDIGVVTTDQFYFAAASLDCDGGATISASHNPRDYNGFKLMRKGGVPISGDSGIQDIQALVDAGYAYRAPQPGTLSSEDTLKGYLDKSKSFLEEVSLKEFVVVANAMNGPALRNLRAAHLPLRIIPINEELDGSFPKGQPDPFQEKNRVETEELIRREKPDLGVAWDADADRFFLFDETGRNIPGYFITALLAEIFLHRFPGAKIIHDPRLTWAVKESVLRAGGVPLENKVGHTFIKERMRREDAVFAGEMSGHFYFRDFYFADNGLIPLFMILEVMSRTGKKVSELFDPFFEKYFISGEMNLPLSSPEAVKEHLQEIEKHFESAQIGRIDGLSLEYPTWRANVRSSNTEPLVRVNVEAKTRAEMEGRRDEIIALLGN